MLKVNEVKLFEFITEAWGEPSIQVKKNDIIEIEYHDFGNTKKTVKGRFVNLEHSEIIVLDISKEFHAQKANIPLSSVIYIEKVD